MRLFRAACAIALAFIALACTGVRAADSFPSRPIEIVVTAAAGGSPDILARLIAPALAARLGQTVTVENRPGGGGNVAGALVARAAPDGHTLFLANDQLAVNQTLFPNLPFRADTSFVPVIQIAAAPQVLAVHIDLPVRNLADFIAVARAAPGQIAVASAAGCARWPSPRPCAPRHCPRCRRSRSRARRNCASIRGPACWCRRVPRAKRWSA